MTKDWMILDFDKNSNINSIPESNILLDDLELGHKNHFPSPSQKKTNYKIPILMGVSFVLSYIYFYY